MRAKARYLLESARFMRENDMEKHNFNRRCTQINTDKKDIFLFSVRDGPTVLGVVFFEIEGIFLRFDGRRYEN